MAVPARILQHARCRGARRALPAAVRFRRRVRWRRRQRQRRPGGGRTLRVVPFRWAGHRRPLGQGPGFGPDWTFGRRRNSLTKYEVLCETKMPFSKPSIHHHPTAVYDICILLFLNLGKSREVIRNDRVPRCLLPTTRGPAAPGPSEPPKAAFDLSALGAAFSGSSSSSSSSMGSVAATASGSNAAPAASSPSTSSFGSGTVFGSGAPAAVVAGATSPASSPFGGVAAFPSARRGSIVDNPPSGFSTHRVFPQRHVRRIPCLRPPTTSEPVARLLSGAPKGFYDFSGFGATAPSSGGSSTISASAPETPAKPFRVWCPNQAKTLSEWFVFSFAITRGSIYSLKKD